MIETCIREKQVDVYIFSHFKDVFPSPPIKRAWGKKLNGEINKENLWKFPWSAIERKHILNYTRPIILQLLHHPETKLGLSLHFKEIKPTEVKEVAKWVREKENILQNHPLIWSQGQWFNFIAHLETKFTMSIGGTIPTSNYPEPGKQELQK